MGRPKGSTAAEPAYAGRGTPAGTRPPLVSEGSRRNRVNDGQLSLQLWEDLKGYPPIGLSDVGEVSARVDEFFELCARRGIKPPLTLLARMLGMSQSKLVEVVSGRDVMFHGLTLEVMVYLRDVYQFMETQLEIAVGEECGNPVKWFFMAKNHYGYKDESIRIVEQKTSPVSQLTPAEIAAKYVIDLGLSPELPPKDPVEVVPESIE